MSSGYTWVCIPVKRFALAKQRLAPVLHAAQRAALAQAMLEDVVQAVTQAVPANRVALATNEPRAISLARTLGLNVIGQAADLGYSEAANTAMQYLLAHGAGAVAIVAADLPLLEPEDVCELLGSTHAIEIAPSHDLCGTNAIVCRPPGCIQLQYGVGSLLRHVHAARDRGLSVRAEVRQRIGLDVDFPRDLNQVLGRLGARRTRTSELLRAWRAAHRESDVDARQLAEQGAVHRAGLADRPHLQVGACAVRR